MVSDRFATKASGLSPAQLALLEQRLKGRASAPRTIPRRATTSFAPLSFAQEESLHVTQTCDVPPSYLGTVLSYSGPLDLRALQRSAAEVTRRHESLRTSIATIDGKTVQVINPPAPEIVTIEDLSDEPASQRTVKVQQLAVQALAQPFDLAASHLWRLKVFSLSSEEYVLAIALSHLIADFLSLGILIQELGAVYESFSHDQPSPLPELPVQYGDWAAWQREKVRNGELAAQFSYWLERLKACPPALELPFTRPRPAAETFQGAIQSKVLPLALSDALRELSRNYRVSLYTSLLAAFGLLVQHYTGREDLVFGRGVTGRTRLETERLIGCFVNMVLMRLDMSGNPTFAELLKRVQAVVDGAYANQDVPYVKLAERLQSRHPLARLFFNLYTAPSAPELEGARLRIFDLGDQRPKDDVALFQDMLLGMQDSGNRLIAELKFNRQLFDIADIEQMLEHYQNVLETIVTSPTAQTSKLMQQASIP